MMPELLLLFCLCFDAHAYFFRQPFAIMIIHAHYFIIIADARVYLLLCHATMMLMPMILRDDDYFLSRDARC